MKCSWCGRIYGNEFTNTTGGFCSEKCRQEYKASKKQSRQPSYSRQESGGHGGGGFLSFIGKLIKWIIIIAIVIFVLAAMFAE